ncbi:MAG: pectate lyase [Chitinophagaceae bacterium]|nr:pectate lyase [Chitinophagaceae bacterium]
MKSRKAILFILLIGSLSSCAQLTVLTQAPDNDQPLAFPGAEGFGKFTTGGRGGKIYIVTNLNDKGPGSFREAVEAKGKRIVLLNVDGTIHLETKLTIRGDVTIAGHSAPGDGICLADQSVSLGGDNIIIRYIRFRMGDKYQKGGMVDGNGGDDAFGGTRRKNIIIDHCSLSWSTDEVFSIYAGDSTTLQWNLIAEPLNYSYHFEKGDTGYEHHGYGGIWGGAHLTAHHNLIAHCNNRNPRFDGIRNAKTELVDYRNNVIYNWGGNTIYAGEGGQYNLVNNYFKYGPSTPAKNRYHIASPGKRDPDIPFGKWFIDGNYVDGSPEMTRDNFLGTDLTNNGTAEDKKNTVISNPHDAVPVPVQSAEKAFEEVLLYVGASFARDTMDARIVNDVKKRTGRFIDVQGGYPHGTEYEKTLNAWPELRAATSLLDKDNDGMPDAWETKSGLNPNNAGDASQYDLDKKYTNIEVYLNSLTENNHK